MVGVKGTRPPSNKGAQNMEKTADFRWIKDGLARRNYLAKDLAKAFGISESSISRMLNGHESIDLPLSRAVTLSLMLGVTLDELAKGLGVMGKRVEPDVTSEARTPKAPPNSVNLLMLDDGKVRLTLSQDTTPTKAMEVIKVLALT